jgi:hypothetical protein
MADKTTQKSAVGPQAASPGSGPRAAGAAAG